MTNTRLYVRALTLVGIVGMSVVAGSAKDASAQGPKGSPSNVAPVTGPSGTPAPPSAPPQNPWPGPTSSVKPPPPPATCNAAQAQKQCQTAEDRAFLMDLLSTYNANLLALNSMKQNLSGQYAQLDAQERALLGSTDNFTVKLTASCGVAALEAVSVAKLAGVARGACSAGGFAVQCARAGFTSKEVATYVARNKEVQAAVVAITMQTATITAKNNTPGSGGLMSYIPILGSTCKANDWGNQIFTAPDVIREIGNSKAAILRVQAQLNALIADTQAKIAEVNDKLSRL